MVHLSKPVTDLAVSDSSSALAIRFRQQEQAIHTHSERLWTPASCLVCGNAEEKGRESEIERYPRKLAAEVPRAVARHSKKVLSAKTSAENIVAENRLERFLRGIFGRVIGNDVHAVMGASQEQTLEVFQKVKTEQLRCVQTLTVVHVLRHYRKEVVSRHVLQ